MLEVSRDTARALEKPCYVKIIVTDVIPTWNYLWNGSIFGFYLCACITYCFVIVHHYNCLYMSCKYCAMLQKTVDDSRSMWMIECSVIWHIFMFKLEDMYFFCIIIICSFICSLVKDVIFYVIWPFYDLNWLEKKLVVFRFNNTAWYFS